MKKYILTSLLVAGLVLSSLLILAPSAAPQKELQKQCKELSTPEKPYHYEQGELLRVSTSSIASIMWVPDLNTTSAALGLYFLLDDGEKMGIGLPGLYPEIESYKNDFTVGKRYAFCYWQYEYNNRKESKVDNIKHIIEIKRWGASAW